MKKFFGILIFTAVVLSCSKENVESQDQPEITSNGRQVCFTVTVEGVDDTRATISSSTNFTWESTDRAAVFSHSGEKVELVPSSISGGSATFTGTLTSDSDYIDEGALVVYPAARLTGTGAAPTVTFPAEYSSASETQGPVLAAKVVSGGPLAFKYLAGTLKITITDVPSVATKFYVNTRNADNSGDVVCTGIFSVDFSGDTPSLTSGASTGQNITITNTASGSTSLYIPLPTAGEQKVYLDVKTTKISESENLFSKGVSLTSTKAVARNSFISMPALTINPSVYMISDMTSWEHGSKVEMTKVGNTASITMNAIANRHWRPIVVYPTGYWVFYGFTGSDNEAASGTFNNVTSTSEGSRKSAIVYSTAGNYTLSFNYVTGAYSAASNGTTSAFYTGTNTYTSTQEMKKLSNTLAFDVRQWGAESTLYAYYNGRSASRGGEYYVASQNYYLWVYNFSTNRLTATWFDTNTGKTYGDVNLEGSFNSWGSTGLTNISGTPAWYINVDWDEKTYFRFKGQGVTSGPYDDAHSYLSSYMPSVTSEVDAYSNTNFIVEKGKYTIIFFENKKWTILNRE